MKTFADEFQAEVERQLAIAMVECWLWLLRRALQELTKGTE